MVEVEMSIRWKTIPDSGKDLGNCIVGKHMPKEFVAHQRTAPTLAWVQIADGYTHYTELDIPTHVIDTWQEKRGER